MKLYEDKKGQDYVDKKTDNVDKAMHSGSGIGVWVALRIIHEISKGEKKEENTWQNEAGVDNFRIKRRTVGRNIVLKSWIRDMRRISGFPETDEDLNVLMGEFTDFEKEI